MHCVSGKKTLIQGQLWDGAIKLIDSTKRSNWQRDIATILSVYYLINVPGSTSFQSWGNGYYYGSSNTYTYNYYKAGVPMNMAYQVGSILMIAVVFIVLNQHYLTAHEDAASGYRHPEDLHLEPDSQPASRVHVLPDHY